MGVKRGLLHYISQYNVPEKIYGPKKDEADEKFRILYYGQLRDIYRSPSIVRIVKFRRLQWAERVARLERTRIVQGI
jgi:hypothetical protein